MLQPQFSRHQHRPFFSGLQYDFKLGGLIRRFQLSFDRAAQPGHTLTEPSGSERKMSTPPLCRHLFFCHGRWRGISLLTSKALRLL